MEFEPQLQSAQSAGIPDPIEVILRGGSIPLCDRDPQIPKKLARIIDPFQMNRKTGSLQRSNSAKSWQKHCKSWKKHRRP